MAKDPKNRQDGPRKMPGGFLLFIIAIILIILTFQTFSSDKSAKISFSHQIEHLVNLDLIKPENNTKVALNDNLVTFSGKFRDTLTEDSQNRFKFLSLLNENHQLTQENERVKKDLDDLEKKADNSIALFLYATGFDLSNEGFVVVSKA